MGIKEVDGYYVDDNNNRWDSKNYSKESIERYSKSMIDCTNCTNCHTCHKCNNLINCSLMDDCNDCVDCYYCIKCNNCTNCIGCAKLNDGKDYTDPT